MRTVIHLTILTLLLCGMSLTASAQQRVPQQQMQRRVQQQVPVQQVPAQAAQQAPAASTPEPAKIEAEPPKPIDLKTQPWLVETARLPEGSSALNRQRMLWADFSSRDQEIAEVMGGPIEVERWVNPPPKDLAGKFVLIEVWATWCPPCRRSLPLMEYYSEKFKDDLVVISICETDEEALKTMEGPLKLADLKAPLAVDTARRFANKLGVYGIPHAVLIEPVYGAVLWEGMPTQIGFELSEDKLAKILAFRSKLAEMGKLPKEAPFKIVACPPDPNKPNEKPKAPIRCAGDGEDGTPCN